MYEIDLQPLLLMLLTAYFRPCLWVSDSVGARCVLGRISRIGLISAELSARPLADIRC